VSDVIDLDILRPKPVLVKLGGKTIDVSFVPCAITFDLDNIIQNIAKLDSDKIKNNDKEEQKKAFDFGIKLCSVFCSEQHPDMTYDWFVKNTDAGQVQQFSGLIKNALMKSYAGVEAYGKN